MKFSVSVSKPEEKSIGVPPTVSEDAVEADHDLNLESYMDPSDADEHKGLLAKPRSAAADNVSADDEFAEILRHSREQLPPYFRDKPRLHKWSQTVTNTNYALLFLGFAEFVVSFLAGTTGFVGSYALYVLGTFGIVAGALSMVSVQGIRLLTITPSAESSATISASRSRPLVPREATQTAIAEGGRMLSWYFNLGCLFLLSFATWTLAVLSMSPLFWRYVEIHWNGNVERAFPGYTAVEAQTHVKLTVVSVSVLAVFSVCLLGISLYGVSLICPDTLIDEQMYLWINLVFSWSGSVLIGAGIYCWYHEGTVPVAPHESFILLACGLVVVGIAAWSIYRLQQWCSTKIDYSYGHVTSTSMVTLVIACCCMVLLHRAFHVDKYLAEDNLFSRYGMYTTEGEDSAIKLEMSAKIQLILLGIATLIITFYSSIATCVAYMMEEVVGKPVVNSSSLKGTSNKVRPGPDIGPAAKQA